MKIMAKLLFLSFFLPFVLAPQACGPAEKLFGRKDIKGGDGIFITARSGTPIIYGLQDPNCDENNAVADLGKTKVWLLKKGSSEVSLTEVDLTGISGRGLESEAIKVALYGSETKATVSCTVNKDQTKNCRMSDGESKKRGKPINICRKGGGYDRNSLENVALAMAAAVKPSWDFYKSLGHKGSEKGAFEKVTLLVHPKFEENIIEVGESDLGSLDKRVHEIMTDNAFFMLLSDQAKNDTYALVAVPQSVERAPRVPIAFWEIPFIFSHEFGHHIFNKHAPSVAPSYLRAVDALNEAFADMFAHLTLESGRHALAGLNVDSDFAIDRDVASPRFANGRSKILNNAVIAAAFANYAHSDGDELANFRDPHILGAVIAYGVNGTLAHKNRITAKSGTLEKNIGLDLLVWLEAMQSRFHAESFFSDSFFLEESVLKLLRPSVRAVEDERLRTFAPNEKVSHETHRDFIYQVFPVYAYRVFQYIY